MAENLEKALELAIAGEMSSRELASPRMPETHEVSQMGTLAFDHYNKAKEYLRQGDWAGYGRELEQLENILKEMSAVSAGKK
jgi:uncharacterized membrane protein (UPF0182 family)